MTDQWPRWIDRSPNHFLREVGQNLYVGAADSPSHCAIEPCLVIGLSDVNRTAERNQIYSRAGDFFVIPIDDGVSPPSGLLERVAELATWRKRMEGPVLLHCTAGLSRSASFAYGLLRLHHDLSHDAALKRVSSGPWPHPAVLDGVRAQYMRIIAQGGQAHG